MKKKNIWIVILLNLVTCGIYSIIFWYSMNEDVNKVSDGYGKRNTNYILMIFLTIITCGIFYFIWLYRLADNLQVTGQQRYGLTINNGGSTVVLWSVLGSLVCGLGYFVTLYFIIDNYNKIADEYNNEFNLDL